MDVKELEWLQQVVPLAFKGLKCLAKLPTAKVTPNARRPPSKRRRSIRKRATDNGSNRRIWVKEENLSRDSDGLFATTFHNHDEFCSRTGMTPQVFDMLFSLVGEQLNKNSIRQPILPECRLFLTLIYLSNAERILDLSMAFKMGSSTVRGIVQETSEILWNTLSPAFLPQPSVDDLRQIVEEFQATWQVPHCLGAVDAKLLDISYKSEHDIILLASCDSNLNFINIDIATIKDVVKNQLEWHHDFGTQLFQQRLGNLLPEESQPGGKNTQANFGYGFIANTSFSNNHLVTPYNSTKLDEDQLNFNRHITRALEGSIDKAFSVLMSRWRVLSEPLRQSPANAEKIVKAAIVLHNFVKQHDETYAPDSYVAEVPDCPNKHRVSSVWLTGVQPSPDKPNSMQLREQMSSAMSCKLESNTFEELVGSVEWND